MNRASAEALDAYRRSLDENDALDPGERAARAAMWRAMLECLGAFDIRIRGHIGAETIIDARHNYQGDWWYVCDNGGELNVGRINDHDTMRSIAYDTRRGMTDGATMAYRVRCVIDGDEIDYARSYRDEMETLRTTQGPNA